MNDIDLLTIPEFLDLTGLSNDDFVNMLQQGELKVTTDTKGTLLIDVSSLTQYDIANRHTKNKKEISKEDLILIEEIIASEITKALDNMIKEGFSLAMSWKDHNQES